MRIPVRGTTPACDGYGSGTPLAHGTGAQASSWGGTVHDLAVVVPGLHAETVDGAGHLGHGEQPEVFAAAVLARSPAARERQASPTEEMT
ncbi:hypothetical protein WHI96_19525 [Pseudonocardia tropica]|uniref:Uncharacterized protein n=1 Tax=Pseudonocardia tropica TaxID=681289 RepID=A0ABV1JYJ1_9PSEU